LSAMASVALMAMGLSTGAQAQQQPPQSPDMTFFVTSSGPGKGADLGGLEGADRHCQTLATAAGAGSKTWHAYRSTNAATQGGADTVFQRCWNAAHMSRSCSQPDLIATGGNGLFYCFAQ